LNRLPAALRSLIYATLSALVATGALWALAHYFPAAAGMDERIAASVASLTMKIHGAAAMAALVLLGTLVCQHVPAGWKTTHNRTSGVLTLAAFSSLILTGYLLYYAGDETYRSLASNVHLALGLGLAVLVVAHVWRDEKTSAA
jgi:hypothetical protein